MAPASDDKQIKDDVYTIQVPGLGYGRVSSRNVGPGPQRDRISPTFEGFCNFNEACYWSVQRSKYIEEPWRGRLGVAATVMRLSGLPQDPPRVVWGPQEQLLIGKLGAPLSLCSSPRAGGTRGGQKLEARCLSVLHWGPALGGGTDFLAV